MAEPRFYHVSFPGLCYFYFFELSWKFILLTVTLMHYIYQQETVICIAYEPSHISNMCLVHAWNIILPHSRVSNVSDHLCFGYSICKIEMYAMLICFFRCCNRLAGSILGLVYTCLAAFIYTKPFQCHVEVYFNIQFINILYTFYFILFYFFTLFRTSYRAIHLKEWRSMAECHGTVANIAITIRTYHLFPTPICTNKHSDHRCGWCFFSLPWKHYIILFK